MRTVQSPNGLMASTDRADGIGFCMASSRAVRAWNGAGFIPTTIAIVGA